MRPFNCKTCGTQILVVGDREAELETERDALRARVAELEGARTSCPGTSSPKRRDERRPRPRGRVGGGAAGTSSATQRRQRKERARPAPPSPPGGRRCAPSKAS